MTAPNFKLRIRALTGAYALTFSAALVLPSGLARAVLFYSTGDPSHNTTAPGGALAGSGWQWQGDWNGSFLGTPIAPQYFITAKHVGGSDGTALTLNGINYVTDSHVNDPNSDLAIWHVTTPFPDYAPLYTGSSELGQGLVVFGRGSQRGVEVTLGPDLKGWTWGPSDGVKRWGQNNIESIINAGGSLGQLLAAFFNEKAGPEESTLSLGDSSGGVFINDGSGWTLAGISYAVSGPFNDTNTGPGFNASIFDARGLYVLDDMNNWVQVSPTLPDPVPGAFVSTRISANLAFIQSVTGIPEPASVGLLAMAGLLLWRRARA